MIIKNVQILKERIVKICDNSGQNPEEITLIAVSKTNPLIAIEEAYSAGIEDFGENKAQEFRDK
ncbi:MAG: YggS family pyridoxal phosphate-dependent enzyme, partial [Melioribacteraceae bacterium]|nr:YggS family pyridoxal phosphate-dependent enzyme [Melioribacteraceae bacterium]